MGCAQELQRLFRRADVDCDSKITMEEFQRFCETPAFVTFLRMRGIDIKEVSTFYSMLMDGAGVDAERHVDVGLLVEVCLRIRGQATSVDLHTLRYELLKMRRDAAETRHLVRQL